MTGMTRREIALGNEVLRGVVGSTAHGTAVDGQDDRDEMGVFVEPAEFVCGLSPCEHYIYRDKPDGVRSGPGDLDLALYSLRKFCGLAAKGNPSILVLLWLPEYIVKTDIGVQLILLRTFFISKEAGARFLGYLRSQKMRLTGERTKTVNRPDLVEKYGYDTKFAMHALRLGYQGLELLQEGWISMPVAEPQLTVLRAVRQGEVNYKSALALISEAEARLTKAYDACELVVDREHINEIMVMAHRRHWEGGRQ